MSISIYCSRFVDEQFASLPIDVVERAFRRYIVARESNALLLRFAAGDDLPLRLQFGTTEQGLDGFALERPTTDPELYECLLVVLEQEGVVMYAPGSSLVVGSTPSAQHLPRDMVQSVGRPIVATSTQSLIDGLFSE